MDKVLKEYLFAKGILVSEGEPEHSFATLFTLANKFAISISEGGELANRGLISFVSDMIGEIVPAPFYAGFPDTVRALSPDALLFDQLLHYTVTYGFGDFSAPGYSYFEADFERAAFRENVIVKKFVILDEESAKERLGEFITDMLAGTRPISDKQFEVLLAYIDAYEYKVESCACKDTVIRLLAKTRRYEYADLIMLSDVIKLVDYINYNEYKSENVRKLNLKNKDRKFITGVINRIFECGNSNERECFEKKSLWNGLLHHIHYKPTSDESAKFVSLMRGRENLSVYSEFEEKMQAGDIKGAVLSLKKGKGSSVIYRNLDYILSRAKNEDEISFVFESLGKANPILLIQLLFRYAGIDDGARVFVFSKYNKMRVHKESDEEKEKRKTVLSNEITDVCREKILAKLKAALANRLGKVYISPEMYKVAIPLGENTSSGGYGVLPKGTRISIGEAKKIRAFTYWEKVDDIDLSVIGLCDDGREVEFSWRTMYYNQKKSITFSGDQTSGYDGGSEYFDIDVKKFRKDYPDIKMLVFSNNVFSYSKFSECVCRAGYMLRDKKDSGEVFEPKTVKSSFVINCDSTFAYLFGIDLVSDEFVWLNAARESSLHIAGESSLSFLERYFISTNTLNVGTVFEMLATEIVASADEADVILSDTVVSEKHNATVIRSFDFEKILSFLN